MKPLECLQTPLGNSLLASNPQAQSRPIGGLIRLVLIWTALLSSQQGALAIHNLKVGDAMPEFKLPKAEKSADFFSSKEMIGKPSAIIFWRPGQKLSLKALRAFEKVIQEIGADKVNTISVDASRSAWKDVQAALADESLSYPALLDPERALYGKVGVIVAPTTLMFDAQGILRFVAPSFPGQYERAARARLRFLLGEIDQDEMDRQVDPAILKIEREQARAWRRYNLARKLEEDGKIDEASVHYEKAIGEFPKLVQAQCALGFLKLAKGEIQLAAALFETALGHQPAFSEANLGKAAVLVRLEQFDEAENILLKLKEEDPVAVRAYYELGRLYQAQGQTAKALEAYEAALSKMYPETPAEDEN